MAANQHNSKKNGAPKVIPDSPRPSIGQLTGFAIQLLQRPDIEDPDDAVYTALTVWRSAWNALSSEKSWDEFGRQARQLSQEPDRISDAAWARVNEHYKVFMGDYPGKWSLDIVANALFKSAPDPRSDLDAFLERHKEASKPEEPVNYSQFIKWAELLETERLEEERAAKSAQMKRIRQGKKKAEK